MYHRDRGRVDLVVENSGGKFLIEQHLTGISDLICANSSLTNSSGGKPWLRSVQLLKPSVVFVPKLRVNKLQTWGQGDAVLFH